MWLVSSGINQSITEEIVSNGRRYHNIIILEHQQFFAKLRKFGLQSCTFSTIEIFISQKFNFNIWNSLEQIRLLAIKYNVNYHL